MSPAGLGHQGDGHCVGTFSQLGECEISSPTGHGHKNKVKQSSLNIEIPNILNEFYQRKNYMEIMENERDKFVKPSIGLTKLINLPQDIIFKWLLYSKSKKIENISKRAPFTWNIRI